MRASETNIITPYSLGEEIANSITHGIGALLSMVGLAFLIIPAVRQGNVWHIVGFSVFGISLIILYLASTLYHSIANPTAKKVFKIIDHSAIFILIAGTYTPFLLINLRDSLGWGLFLVIWAMAIAGVVFKSIFIAKFRKLSVAVYVVMGWISILVVKELFQTVPITGMILLALGGFFYTTGVIFYVWKRLPYNHAVWHLFVLCGSVCHYFAVLYC